MTRRRVLVGAILPKRHHPEGKRMPTRVLVFAACLATVAMQVATVHACGYDDPKSIQLGTLNWAYPDALYVHSAVADAEAVGLIPPEPAADDGLSPLQHATAMMKEFGAKLFDERLADRHATIAVVLIPQVMWTRFTIDPAGISMQEHVDGPSEHDLVIVTEEKVIHALLDEKLGADMAENKGLIRFYGATAEIAEVRAALAKSPQQTRLGDDPSHAEISSNMVRLP
jgi:hypothetical protein